MPVKKKAVKKAVKRVGVKKSLLKSLGDQQQLLGAVPGSMSGLGTSQAQIMYDPKTMSGGNIFGDLIKVLNPAGLVASVKGDRKGFLKVARDVTSTDLGKSVAKFYTPGQSTWDTIGGVFQSLPVIAGAVKSGVDDVKGKVDNVKGQVASVRGQIGVGKRKKRVVK